MPLFDLAKARYPRSIPRLERLSTSALRGVLVMKGHLRGAAIVDRAAFFTCNDHARHAVSMIFERTDS